MWLPWEGGLLDPQGESLAPHLCLKVSGAVWVTITIIIITQWSHLFCQGGNHDNSPERSGGSPSSHSPSAPGGCRGGKGRGAKPTRVEMPPSWAGWWKKQAVNSPYPSPRFVSLGFSAAAAERTHRIHLCHPLPLLNEGKHPNGPQNRDASPLTGLLCSPRLDLSSTLAVVPVPISAHPPSPPQEHSKPLNHSPHPWGSRRTLPTGAMLSLRDVLGGIQSLP